MSKELVKKSDYRTQTSFGDKKNQYRPIAEQSKPTAGGDKKDLPVVDNTQMAQAHEIAKSRGSGEGSAQYLYKRLQLAQSIGESQAAGKKGKAGHKLLDSHYKNMARIFDTNTYNAMYGLQDNSEEDPKMKFEKKKPHKMQKGDHVCTNDNYIGELQSSQIQGPKTMMVFQDRTFYADSFSNDFSIMTQDESPVASTSAQGPATFKEDLGNPKKLEDYERENAKKKGFTDVTQMQGNLELHDDDIGTQKGSLNTGKTAPTSIGNRPDGKFSTDSAATNNFSRKGLSGGHNNMQHYSPAGPGQTSNEGFQKFAAQHTKGMAEGSLVKFENKQHGTTFHGMVTKDGGLSPLQSQKGHTKTSEVISHYKNVFSGPNATKSTHEGKDSFAGTLITSIHKSQTDKSLAKPGQGNIDKSMNLDKLTARGHETSNNFLRDPKNRHKTEELAHHTRIVGTDKTESSASRFDKIYGEKKSVTPNTYYSPTGQAPDLIKKTTRAHTQTESKGPSGETVKGREFPTSSEVVGGFKPKPSKEKSNYEKGLNKPAGDLASKQQNNLTSFKRNTETKGAGKDSAQGAMNLQKDLGSIAHHTLRIDVLDKNNKKTGMAVSGPMEHFKDVTMQAHDKATKAGHSLKNAVFRTYGPSGSSGDEGGSIRKEANARYQKTLSNNGQGAKDRMKAYDRGTSKTDSRITGLPMRFTRKDGGRISNVTPEGEPGKKWQPKAHGLGGMTAKSDDRAHDAIPKASGSGAFLTTGIKDLGHQDVNKINHISGAWGGDNSNIDAKHSTLEPDKQMAAKQYFKEKQTKPEITDKEFKAQNSSKKPGKLPDAITKMQLGKYTNRTIK